MVFAVFVCLFKGRGLLGLFDCRECGSRSLRRTARLFEIDGLEIVWVEMPDADLSNLIAIAS